MAPKWFIYFCITLGSMIGAYIPLIWGAGMLSFSSVMFSGLGAILGMWAAFKVGNAM
jgi:hypothetical protein